MNTVGIKEFQQHASRFSKRVQKGETIIVYSRSKPVMKVSPVDEDAGWETVVDFTKLRKGGIPAKELLDRLRSID